MEKKDLFNLKEKTAIITGGGNGIGKGEVKDISGTVLYFAAPVSEWVSEDECDINILLECS